MEELFFDFYKPVLEEQKLSETVFAALDLETTGLYPSEDRVTEIGIVKFTLNGEKESFNTLINPGRNIPAESVKISGITNQMVENAPDFCQVFEKITAILKDTLIIAHNFNFDYSFLKMESEKAGFSFNREIGIDTVSLSRRFLKGHRSYSLQNLAKDLNLPVENAHRALDDARLCMNVFRQSIGNIERSETMTVKELFHSSNTRIKGV